MADIVISKRLYHFLRAEWMMWLGALGGALTLLASLEPLLDLANWARFVVTNWRMWTHGFWDWLLANFSVTVSPLGKDVLTFDLFVAALGVRALVARIYSQDQSNPLSGGENETIIGRLAHLLTGLGVTAALALVFLVSALLRLNQGGRDLIWDVDQNIIVGSLLLVAVMNAIGDFFRPRLLYIFITLCWRSFVLCCGLLGLSYLSLWAPLIQQTIKPPAL